MAAGLLKKKKKRRTKPRAQPESVVAGKQQPDLIKLLIGTPESDNDGIVCSWPWAADIQSLTEDGQLAHKKTLIAEWGELYRQAEYPPGGARSRMRACLECGRDCPPAPIKPRNFSEEQIDNMRRWGMALPTEGRCCDCLADLKAPPPSRGDRAAGTFSPFVEALLRLSVFVRVKDADGFIVLIPQELKGDALRERRLKELASERQLRKEMARYTAGTWKPGRTP